jgi:4'-phosphopantetheinyl transferase
MSLPVTSGDVRVVWCATSALAEEAVNAAAALLSADEDEHAQRLRFREDARDYAVAHALLRRELSRGSTTAPTAWSFDRGAHGKPCVGGPGAAAASFSLSHTRGMVACALAPPDIPIGVDVESNQRDLDAVRLAERFFAATEVAALAALPERARRERFYDLWTVKEAVVKAVGVALPPALPHIAVEIRSDRDIELTRSPGSAHGVWQLELFTPARGFRLALAILRPSGSPPLRISFAEDQASRPTRQM